MVISIIEKILSSIFQNSVENFLKRRPDDFTSKNFFSRFKSLQTIFSKICFFTILDTSILFLNTKEKILLLSSARLEKLEKMSRFWCRPDNVRTKSEKTVLTLRKDLKLFFVSTRKLNPLIFYGIVTDL